MFGIDVKKPQFVLFDHQTYIMEYKIKQHFFLFAFNIPYHGQVRHIRRIRSVLCVGVL